MRILIILFIFPLSVFSQVPDSLRPHLDNQNNNPLPYLHCPVEIHFNLYNESDGYIIIKDKLGKEFKKVEIEYPQYPFMIFDDCNWPNGKYTMYTYNLKNKLLNTCRLEINSQNRNGKVNVGEFMDRRKAKIKTKKENYSK